MRVTALQIVEDMVTVNRKLGFPVFKQCDDYIDLLESVRLVSSDIFGSATNVAIVLSRS